MEFWTRLGGNARTARAVSSTWLGKESLDCPRHSRIYYAVRLDLIASLEAMRMLESGVASAEDIDRAAVLAYRHPVGRYD